MNLDKDCLNSNYSQIFNEKSICLENRGLNNTQNKKNDNNFL